MIFRGKDSASCLQGGFHELLPVARGAENMFDNVCTQSSTADIRLLGAAISKI